MADSPLARSLKAGFGDEEAAESIRSENAARQAPNANPSADSYFRTAVTDSKVKGTTADVTRAQLKSDNEAAQKAVASRKIKVGPTGHELSDRVADRSAEHDADAEGMISGISKMVPVTKKDPLHGPVTKHNAEVRDARGDYYGAKQDEQDVDQAKVDAYKEHLAGEFVRLKGETDAAQAVQEVRQDRLMQQEEAVKGAKIAQTLAIEKLASAPPEDAGRYWASQSGFRKFMYALSAGLLGAAGMDPFAHIQAAIQQDVEAQRSSLGQIRSEIEARGGDFTAQQNIYGQIMESVQDERTADLILQNARWKQAEAEMMALAAKFGAAAMGPQQEQLLAQIREQMATGDLQLSQLAVRHPYSRTTMKHKMNATERGLRTKQFDASLDRAGATEAASIGIAQKAVENEPNPNAGPSIDERKVRVAEANQRLSEKKHEADQRGALVGTAQDQAASTALGLAQDYLKKYADDIPDRTESGAFGRAWASLDELGLSTEAGKDEKRERAILGQWFVTGLTGANVSKRQEEFLEKFAGGYDMSGDEIRAGIADLARSLELRVGTRERAVDDEAVADYRGVPVEELAPHERRYGGRGRPTASDETFGGVEE